MFDKKEWDANSDKYLLDNYEKMSYRKLAEHLGRSQHGIRNRLKILGSKNKKHCACWTTEEDMSLKDMYEKGCSLEDMCIELGRSKASVRLRANKKLNAFRDDRYLKLEFRSDDFYSSLKRALVAKTAKSKCCLCDYSKHIDLHHKDGNRSNNHCCNIASLCPNHHREVEAGEHKDKKLTCIWWRVYASGKCSDVVVV